MLEDALQYAPQSTYPSNMKSRQGIAAQRVPGQTLQTRGIKAYGIRAAGAKLAVPPHTHFATTHSCAGNPPTGPSLLYPMAGYFTQVAADHSAQTA